MNHQKEHWGSRTGVVLAVAGGAIGLGNFLRFPGQVVNYGGGAFMIPYMISLLLVAIPLASLEWALGRRGGRYGYHSALGIYYRVSGGKKSWGLVGGMAAIIPVIINIYYIFIEAWCLLYALQYLGGCLNAFGLGFSLLPEVGAGLNYSDAESYSTLFGKIVGVGGNGSALALALILTAACVVINFLLVYRGIAKGIERFNKFVAPLMFLCSICIVARVMTLSPEGTDGRTLLDGLGFMWNPTRPILDETGGIIGQTTIWTTLSDPETWLAATAQIFFTVSICLCSTCSYASYIKDKEDVALSSATATAANEFCEVALAGLTIVPPTIMFLGLNAADYLGSSFAVGFIALPNVFGLMPAGQFCGFMFFSLLFLSAITSSMSLAQVTVATLREGLACAQRRAAAISIAITAVGTGIVCLFTENLAALDSFDFWLANFGPFLFAVCQTFFIVWTWGVDAAKEELDRGAIVKFPRWAIVAVKGLTFPYLIAIFLFWCWKNLGGRIKELASNGVAQLSIAFIVALMVALIVVSLRAMKRWDKEEASNVAPKT